MRQTHTPQALLRRGCRRRWALPTMAVPVVLIVIVAALATAAPLVHGTVEAAADELPPADLLGYWYTVANGDRVADVLVEDDIVWSATQGGGVVQWDAFAGSHRQFLAPQHGLPSNDVRALLRHDNGTLFAATSQGLATLDAGGSSWRDVPMDNPAIRSPSTTALAAGSYGVIWVGFEQVWDAAAPHPIEGRGAFVGGGLAMFDPATGQWGPIVRASLTDDPDERPLGLPSENVTTVAVDLDDQVWVGTRPYYRWRDDVCGRPNCPPELSAWAPDGGGLAATDDPQHGWRQWSSRVGSSCEASTDQITDLVTDDGVRMWVGTGGRGLQLYMNGLDTRLCKPETGHRYWEKGPGGLPGTQVHSLAAGAPGLNEMWMGVGEGDRGLGVAVLHHQGTFEPPDQPSDDVWQLDELFGYSGRHDAIPAAISFWQAGLVIGTRDERNGDGWGVLLRNHGSVGKGWRALTTSESGPRSNQITAVAADSATNATWFGTRNRGVARWDGSTWTTWGSFDPHEPAGDLLSEGVRTSETISLTLTADEFQRLFPGPMRLMRFEHDRTLYELGPPRTVEGGVKASVRPKLQKGYPAGTGLTNIRRGPAGDEVTSIAVDNDGRAWVGAMPSILRPAPPSSGQSYCETFPDCWYDGGMSRFEGNGDTWTTFNPKPEGGTPIRDVLALAVDTRGNVWAGTGDPGSDAGQGVAVYDVRTEQWDVRSRATEGSDFGGDVVTGVAVDSLTGDVWLSTHHTHCTPGSLDCGPKNREGGGVSRWDGRSWSKWVQNEDSNLTANGTDGNFASITFDAGRARVWAGAWAEGSGILHWLTGRGIDASANGCPRNCNDQSWAHQLFVDEGAVRALAVDSDNNVWLGSSRDNRGVVPHPGGVKLFDGDIWTRQSTDLWSNEVTALAREGDGMWVGTYDGGAARWRPAELKPGAYLPRLRK